MHYPVIVGVSKEEIEEPVEEEIPRTDFGNVLGIREQGLIKGAAAPSKRDKEEMKDAGSDKAAESRDEKDDEEELTKALQKNPKCKGLLHEFNARNVGEGEGKEKKGGKGKGGNDEKGKKGNKGKGSNKGGKRRGWRREQRQLGNMVCQRWTKNQGKRDRKI